MITTSKEATWLLEGKYNGTESPEYFADLKRLEAGEPLAYVIGWVPFGGAKIYLDSQPLIPRPETEYWVTRIADEIQQSASSTDNLRVLDLCAGSGAIGITLLLRLRGASVDFAEIDRAHHMTILKNLAENRVDMRRTHVLGGDLFQKVDGIYDYIFANPPYVDPELSYRVDPSVVAHEPAGAIWGGENGMALIRRVIGESWAHLIPGGSLFIEHEPEQVEEILKVAEQCGYAAGLTLKDQYGTLRMSALQKP